MNQKEFSKVLVTVAALALLVLIGVSYFGTQQQQSPQFPEIVYDLCVHESGSRNSYSQQEYTTNDGEKIHFSGSEATAFLCEDEQGKTMWRVLEGSILDPSFFYFDIKGSLLAICGFHISYAEGCSLTKDISCNFDKNYCAEL